MLPPGPAIGDPLPWVTLEMTGHGTVRLEAFGGLRTIFLFCATMRDPRIERVCRELIDVPTLPDGRSAALVIVCADRAGALAHPLFAAVSARIPFLWDDSLALHDALGLRDGDSFRLCALQVDEAQRIVARIPFEPPASFVHALLAEPARAAVSHPPVLSVPGVLDEADCQALLEAWAQDGGEESGYMLPDAQGVPVEILNAGRKRRRDFVLDPKGDLYRHVWSRVTTRLAPALRRAFQFDLVGAERLLVGRYAADAGGHFEKHRDWEDDASHREFGLTINLNADFAGGALAFPEYPGHAYVPAPGTALAYSGALMHRVTPVTSGSRYCLLSFLYGARGQAALEQHIERHGRTYRKLVLS